MISMDFPSHIHAVLPNDFLALQIDDIKIMYNTILTARYHVSLVDIDGAGTF